MKTKGNDAYSGLDTAAEKPYMARATHCFLSLSVTLYIII